MAPRRELTGPLLAADGEADCEQRDDWFLEQDVNAWTSLAYVAAGVVVAVAVVRRRMPPTFAALAAVSAAEGAGSLLYHGNPGDVAQFLHDVSLVGALGFVAGWHAGRTTGSPDRGALLGLGIGVVAGGAAWAVAPGATNVVVGLLVGAIVVAEVLARRRGASPVWNAPLLVLGAAAIATWVVGTPDSPLCDERSWAQPHGLWHVLTALLVLAWVDRAAAAAWPDRAPRLFRRATDRLLGLLAAGLVLAFHRSVDVAGRARIPRHRPVLIVANHGNGFVDPIVVTAVLGRLPRFLAKAALWKVVLARPFLGLAGVLPVYRSADGDRSSDNRSVFDACHRELAAGATVAIFPEGTTGDRAGLDRVRAGAARIALGAVAIAPDLVLVPVGLAFESRIETRSRAAVMVGPPIEVAPWARRRVVDGEPDHDDVRALTDRIRRALEAVSPEFATVDERDVLRAAARTTRRASVDRTEPTFGDVEVLARRLAAAPAEPRQRVGEAFGRYATRLQLIGVSDRALGPAGSSRPRLLLAAVVLGVFGSVVVTATLIHLPAVVLVVVATGAVRSTATKGTVRMLVGIVVGLATWIVAGIVIADGAAAVLAGALVALQGLLALLVWAPLSRAAATLWGRLRARDRAGLLPPLLADRASLIAAVEAADHHGAAGG